jgi:uncharacterized protein YukE
MSDSFMVNHSSYGDVNVGLAASVTRMDAIMEDLNAALQRIGQASQGKATPLWIEQQTAWNNAYLEMKNQLNGHTQASINVAQTFSDGDDNGARVMAT